MVPGGEVCGTGMVKIQPPSIGGVCVAFNGTATRTDVVRPQFPFRHRQDPMLQPEFCQFNQSTDKQTHWQLIHSYEKTMNTNADETRWSFKV